MQSDYRGERGPENRGRGDSGIFEGWGIQTLIQKTNTHQNIHKEGNILRQASVDVILSSDVQSCCCYNVSVRQVLKKPTSLMSGGGCYLDPSILSFLPPPPPPPEYAPKSGIFDKRLLRLYQLKCLSTSESMGWTLNHSFKS